MKLKKYSSHGGLQGRRVRALERLKKQENSTNVEWSYRNNKKQLKRLKKEIEILTKRVQGGISHG